MSDARTLAASLPEEFQEYCSLREGLGQICSFIAVVAGMKPVLDDWIPPARLGRLRRLCASMGVTVEADETFLFLDEAELGEVVGGELLNTTRARAVTDAHPGGLLHVYIGRDPGAVEAARRSGWYGLITGNRVVPKPFIDHHWLGALLGYPPCCLASFAHHGAWNVANPYADAASGTTAAHPLANPVLRHTGLSYVVHYPCTFDCGATVAYGEAVRRAVYQMSPQLGHAADAAVSGPFLLLSGWNAFVFDGALHGRAAIRYRAVRPAPTNRVDAELAALLSSGDEVVVRGDVLVVFKERRPIGSRQVRADRYAPEHPVVVDFDANLLGAPELDAAAVLAR